MSPALALLLSFGAGLATGLAHFLAPMVAFLAMAGVALLLWRARRPATLWPLAALAGLGTAALQQARDTRSCARSLPAGTLHLAVRLREPVFPDQPLAPVRLSGLGCDGAVTARWEQVELPAGATGEVTGRWVSAPPGPGRPGGTLVVRQFSRGPDRAAPTDRLRTWLGRTIRRLYGTRAPSVEALLLNRRGGMPPELRDRYARAGLAHLLSISGFHVGIILGWALLLLRLVTPRRHRIAAAGVLVALAYVGFIGWPPPAARAALLAALLAQARWRQRALAPLPLLAFTGLLVVAFDPWAVVQPGAWLSLAALAGVIVATRWSDRRLGPAWHWRMLAASVGATVATAPITAVSFGTVSLAGIGLNFVAVPLAALIIPGLLASLLASVILPGVAAALAAGSGALLGLLDRLAWWGGSLDTLVITGPMGAAAALPWLGVLGVAWWCVHDQARGMIALRRALAAVVLASWIGVGAAEAGALHDAGGGLSLHFLDVGQGDAALLRTPGGHWVLVDAGPRGDHTDAGRRVVAPFLARHRVGRLSAVIVSHAHLDHLGGVPAVLERVPAQVVLEPAELVPDAAYLDFLGGLEAAGTAWRQARDGLHFELDGVRFSFLHPDPAWQEWQLDLNEDSAVLLVEYGGFRALFPGDAGLVAERRLAGRVGPVSVLKVAHHGSRSATGDAWLAELSPRVAVVSSGTGNRYGHPHAEVLERLRARGVALWRTDEAGSISIDTDGRTLRVTAGGRVATYPVVPRACAPGGAAPPSAEDHACSPTHG